MATKDRRARQDTYRSYLIFIEFVILSLLHLAPDQCCNYYEFTGKTRWKFIRKSFSTIWSISGAYDAINLIQFNFNGSTYRYREFAWVIPILFMQYFNHLKWEWSYLNLYWILNFHEGCPHRVLFHNPN